jgi:hypothetical protein
VGGASQWGRLVAVSRFVNFPIVILGKSLETRTLNPTPRANLCITLGGFMKGEKAERAVEGELCRQPAGQ